MNKTVFHILRFLLGFVFLFSGITKLIDPVGTQIKMLEYFSADVLNLEFLNAVSLEISIFLIVMELTLGWWLILGYRFPLTITLTGFLTLFFLFLTGYSAITGKVTDCGCFGDAVKLTPRETFYKNVFLLIIILYLWKNRKSFSSPAKTPLQILAYAVPVLSVFFAVWTVRHLPVIDFRPYAVGKNIKKGMEIPPGAPEFKYEEIWYYKVNGKVRTFKTKDRPWDIPGAEFVKRETREIQKGYIPPIHDFSIENETENITAQVLDAPDIWLILITEPGNLTSRDLKNLDALRQYFSSRKIPFVIMTSDITPALSAWAQKDTVSLYLTDQTTLKTMIRTGLGVMHLQNATVKEKYTAVDFLKKYNMK